MAAYIVRNEYDDGRTASVELWVESPDRNLIGGKRITLYDAEEVGRLLPAPSLRQQRASTIITNGALEQLAGGLWWVQASDGIAGYFVTPGESCTCPDWTHRQPAGGCKHLRAVALAQPKCRECGRVLPKPNASGLCPDCLNDLFFGPARRCGKCSEEIDSRQDGPLCTPCLAGQFGG